MITVSSCGVKLQEVLSGLERERLKHWRYTCTFVAFLNITLFLFFFPLGVYRIAGNFRWVQIFAIFADRPASAKIKTAKKCTKMEIVTSLPAYVDTN